MIDFSKTQLFSDSSSQKVLQQGSGSFITPSLAGAGEVSKTEIVAHGFNSDNLLIQVSAASSYISGGGVSDYVMLPWQSNDGRVLLCASVDKDNLYITRVNTDSGGSGWPETTTFYSYRILVP